MAASRGRTRKIEKDAWDWAENVDCDAITNEHLEKAYRIQLTCTEKNNHRKNCKGNPNCLTDLGEKYWMKELADDVWYDSEDPEKEKRSEGSFVGLKNLGATCYVNTFLQVWFHNVEFRSALYSWVQLTNEPTISQAQSQNDIGKDEYDHFETQRNHEMSPVSTYKVINRIITEPNNYELAKKDSHALGSSVENSSSNNTAFVCPPIPTCQPWGDDLTPKSFCHHLQLLFAQLQYTSRRFIDPAPFVDSLGLDKEQQQDAQEFCKLFMCLLEETLSQQPVPVLRNIVQQQFGGGYVYITRCSNCGKESQRKSKFYELDLNIHGHASLAQCIKEFLKEEYLEGDNQYFCSFCKSKQNATRHIKLQQLPPVLNLQLLRFVFDRKTGYKKKLNNSIYFPEVLDMKEYVDENLGCVYDLTAVLIHRGLSAYSGHYVAHIKDRKNGIWHRFNDEAIEKMKGKTLSLDSEEDLLEGFNGSTAPKKMKFSKGSQSKDAYMLVYSRRGDEKELVAQEPPPDIQELVAKDNSRLDEWIREVQAVRDKMALYGRERQTEMKRVYDVIAVDEAEEYEWVSTEWLRKWLAFDRKEAIPIDNSSLLCPHGRFHPDKVMCAKRISVKAATFFFKRYGGFPRLKSDSFCVTCVKERCRNLQFSSHLCEDEKYFTKALKITCERTGFWASKNCLRRWKTLAKHGHPNPTSPVEAGMSDSPGEPNEDITTNSETNLEEVGSDARRRVESTSYQGSEAGSVEVDDGKEITFNEDLTCEHGCLSTSEMSRRLVSNDVWKRLRFYFPSSPEFPWHNTSCSICLERDRNQAKKIKDLKELASKQKAMLGLLYSEKERPDFKTATSMTVYVLSRTFYDQWKKFVRCSTRCECPPSITNNTLICPHGGFFYQPECEDNDGASSTLIYIWSMEWEKLTQEFEYDIEIKIVKELLKDKENLLITPECCIQCNTALVAEHFSETEMYECANVYVRKITDQHTQEEIQAILESYRSMDCATSMEDISDSMQFSVGNTPKAAPDDQRRRSSRHRKQRGEVVLTVDSYNTVRDIKLQVMKSFSVMPLDQHLSLNGVTLENDNATVGSVGIKPGSILLLKVDEPQEGIAQEELARASRKPEEGFKGTSLVKHSPMT